MMPWSRTHTLIGGVALILATNAVALMGVAYNRSGEPESVLRLTQRELEPPYRSWRDRENSGIALRLTWRVLVEETPDSLGQGRGYSGRGSVPAWLNEAKLAALGFDVSQLEETKNAGRRHRQQLSREVLLALELDGPAYREALERVKQRLAREDALYAANPGKKEFEQRSKYAHDLMQREEREHSRLFVVDAGLDAAALRAAYPDPARYAIVRGQVRPALVGSGHAAELSGYISELSIGEINVPHAFREVFEPALRDLARGQRNGMAYEVTVAFGKRLEPWITTVSRNAGSK